MSTTAIATTIDSYETAQARITAAYNAAEESAFRAMTHSCDGPVDAFVIMARAVKLARRGECTPIPGMVDDPIANALDRALAGCLTDDADQRLSRRHPSNGS